MNVLLYSLVCLVKVRYSNGQFAHRRDKSSAQLPVKNNGAGNHGAINRGEEREPPLPIITTIIMNAVHIKTQL